MSRSDLDPFHSGPEASGPCSGNKRKPKVSSSVPTPGQSLACPFHKAFSGRRELDPVCSKGWPTFHRLKEHLLRKHAVAESEDRRSRSSTPKQKDDNTDDPPRRPPHLYMNSDCTRALSGRSKRIPDAVKWRRTWMVQFPDIPIPSPYVERDTRDPADPMDAVLNDLIQFAHDEYSNKTLTFWISRMECPSCHARVDQNYTADIFRQSLELFVLGYQSARRRDSKSVVTTQQDSGSVDVVPRLPSPGYVPYALPEGRQDSSYDDESHYFGPLVYPPYSPALVPIEPNNGADYDRMADSPPSEFDLASTTVSASSDHSSGQSYSRDSDIDLSFSINSLPYNQPPGVDDLLSSVGRQFSMSSYIVDPRVASPWHNQNFPGPRFAGDERFGKDPTYPSVSLPFADTSDSSRFLHFRN